MSVDPTAALVVNIASAPGTFAFFLGAGISEPAGIPTGGQILKQVCEEYYRTVEKEEPENDLDVVEWAHEELDLDEFTFSSIIEAIYDQNELAEDFLRDKFEGAEPTEAHKILAELASDGWIKTFVTTNFDRLLEDALEASDVSYTTVAKPEDLETARPREHSPVYILKIHGDHRRGGLRITEEDTSSLPEEFGREFRQILKDYGLVTVGYSGSDGSFQNNLHRQRPRNGLYLTYRDQINDRNVNDLIDALDARTIACEDADSFCRDLQQRISALEGQPSGKSPENHRNEMIHMIREGDEVGLQLRAENLFQELKQKTIDFIEEQNGNLWYEDRPQHGSSYEEWNHVCQPLLDYFTPVMDNYIAATIAAAEFNPTGLNRFLTPLPKYYRFEYPDRGGTNPKVLKVSKVPAYLISYSLLVAGLLKEIFELFSIAHLTDPENGHPWWLVQKEPHHQDIFERQAGLTEKFLIDWLKRSKAISKCTGIEQDVEIAAGFINVLLGIAENCCDLGQSYWWGFLYDGYEYDEYVKRIAFDHDYATGASKILGSGPDQLRENFESSYETVYARISEACPSRAGSPISEDTLCLLNSSN